MNEPAIRTEEQIISLFPDRETLICRGWVLKRMELSGGYRGSVHERENAGRAVPKK